MPNIAGFGLPGRSVVAVDVPARAPVVLFRETLPRLLRDCGFEPMEVKTLRGDGSNLYQYALMAAEQSQRPARA